MHRAAHVDAGVPHPQHGVRHHVTGAALRDGLEQAAAVGGLRAPLPGVPVAPVKVDLWPHPVFLPGGEPGRPVADPAATGQPDPQVLALDDEHRPGGHVGGAWVLDRADGGVLAGTPGCGHGLVLVAERIDHHDGLGLVHDDVDVVAVGDEPLPPELVPGAEHGGLADLPLPLLHLLVLHVVDPRGHRLVGVQALLELTQATDVLGQPQQHPGLDLGVVDHAHGEAEHGPQAAREVLQRRRVDAAVDDVQHLLGGEFTARQVLCVEPALARPAARAGGVVLEQALHGTVSAHRHRQLLELGQGRLGDLQAQADHLTDVAGQVRALQGLLLQVGQLGPVVVQPGEQLVALGRRDTARELLAPLGADRLQLVHALAHLADQRQVHRQPLQVHVHVATEQVQLPVIEPAQALGDGGLGHHVLDAVVTQARQALRVLTQAPLVGPAQVLDQALTLGVLQVLLGDTEGLTGLGELRRQRHGQGLSLRAVDLARL